MRVYNLDVIIHVGINVIIYRRTHSQCNYQCLKGVNILFFLFIADSIYYYKICNLGWVSCILIDVLLCTMWYDVDNLHNTLAEMYST